MSIEYFFFNNDLDILITSIKNIVKYRITSLDSTSKRNR